MRKASSGPLSGGGYGVVRWDPHTGKSLEKVTCPAPYVTCPTFGGANLDTLFFTTAKKGRDEMVPASEEAAGDLFWAQPGALGLPGYRFQG